MVELNKDVCCFKNGTLRSFPTRTTSWLDVAGCFKAAGVKADEHDDDAAANKATKPAPLANFIIVVVFATAAAASSIYYTVVLSEMSWDKGV